MEMEFSKSAVSCLRQILCTTANQEQAHELRLGDGMPDAGKVIGCWAQVFVRGKQWREHQIGVSAGCTLWVLYAPEDGSAAQMVQGYLPVQMQWDLPAESDRGEIQVCMAISGMDARIASPRKLVARVNIVAQVQVFVHGSVTSYEAKDMPENVQLLKRTYPVTLLREAGEKMAHPEQRFSVKEAEQVLCYCVTPTVTETKISSGRLLIKGVGRLWALFMGRDGNVFSRRLELPFSQLADLDDTLEDASAEVCVCPSGLEVELLEDGELKVSGDFVCQYGTLQRREITLLEDAYCNHTELEPLSGTAQLPVVLDRVSGKVDVEIPWAQDGEIVDCSFRCAIWQVRNAEGEGICDLKGICQILYYDREGKLDGRQLTWEGTKGFEACDGITLCITSAETSVPEVKHGAILAELDVNGVCVALEEKPILTGIILGEMIQREEPWPSLILCRGGNRDLWQLAKEHSSTVEAIVKANDLTDGPVGDVFLLIPVI